MVKIKKALSIVMALTLLLSVFSFAANALSYVPVNKTGNLTIKFQASKGSTVTPGEIVQIDMYVDAQGKYTAGDFGPSQFVISYNANQLAPATTVNTTFRTFNNGMAKFIAQTSTVNFKMPVAVVNKELKTQEERDYYTGAIMVTGVVNTAAGIGNNVGSGWAPENATTSMMTFFMKVADNAKPGEEIWVGVHDVLFTKGISFISQAGGNKMPGPEYNLTDSIIKLTVATPAVAGPKLVKSNSQIKFYGTKPTANDGFDYRLISKITDADWTKYFANTGVANATTNAITEAGFVAHDKSGGAFDLATAQNVAKGTPTAGYKTASTTYVSKTTGTDATFGCRITDVLHTTQTTDIDCLAYVKYLDNAGAPQYIFYDAAFNAAVATNYTTALTAWQNAA